MTPLYDPAYSAWGFSRELVARPADEVEGKALLIAIVDRETARIDALLAEHAEIDGASLEEVADRASFDASAAGERLRRFQSARNRDLTRLLDALAKLRKTTVEKRPKEPKPRPSAAASQVEPPTLPPAAPPSKPVPRERKETKTRKLTSQAIETVVAEGLSEYVISLIQGEQAQAGRVSPLNRSTLEATPSLISESA